MIDVKNLNYAIKDDVSTLVMLDKVTNKTSEDLNISKATLYEIFSGKNVDDETLEKVYSYFYDHFDGYNQLKFEVFYDEVDGLILYHGSKDGLREITIQGSRVRCDFGQGFYLGESYQNALDFVSQYEKSSVYLFECYFEDLNVVEFNLGFEWMVAICYFRGTLNEYKNHPLVQKVIRKVLNADVIIAPIADNRMFEIMTRFANGEINVDVALHTLGASDLGKQYVIKTEKALSKIRPLEKLYVCKKEKEASIRKQDIRGTNIDEKIKRYMREYRNSKFIDEVFK